MPRGSYLHRDPHDGVPLATEEFQAAAGPVGWRYVGTLREPEGGQAVGRIDVTVDRGWRQLRVELASGGWLLRGGVAGRETAWVRTAPEEPGPPDERAEPAAGFAGRSPGLLVPLARRLGLEPGGRVRVRVVEVTWPALATRVLEQGWQLVGVEEHATETTPLPVERYELADLETGEQQSIYLAGDVVLAGPALELASLDSPPTLAD